MGLHLHLQPQDALSRAACRPVVPSPEARSCDSPACPYLRSKLPGVVRTSVGYTGGKTKSPTYDSVCDGDGHTEAMRIWFDASVTSYDVMVEVG